MHSSPCRSLVTVWVLGLVAAGCGRSSPVEPAAIPESALANRLASSHLVVQPLIQGTFALASPKGDALNGTYAGEAKGLYPWSTAELTLVLTGGTGAFAGASGTLTGVGTGAFAGEGDFSVVFEGTVTTDEGTRNMRIAGRGTAVLTCLNGTPLLSQQAVGNAVATGRITLTLSHLVGNATCQ